MIANDIDRMRASARRKIERLRQRYASNATTCEALDDIETTLSVLAEEAISMFDYAERMRQSAERDEPSSLTP